MQSLLGLKKQKGLTGIQIVVGLFIVGAVLTIVLRIFPHYMDSFAIQDTLKVLGENSQFKDMERDEIVKKLQTSFDLNGVRGKPSQSIKIDRRTDGWLVNIDYEERIPLIGNADLILTFEHQLNAAKPNDCCKKIVPDIVKE